MTRTDQAFIEAYQRSTAKASQAPPAHAVSHETAGHATLQGPHAPFGDEHVFASKAMVRDEPPFGDDNVGAEKPPLTEAIAERMRQAAESMAPALPDCALQVETFRWPERIEKLAEHHAEDYLAACSQAVSLGRGHVLGFAGVYEGSGASTTTLAMARSLAAEHGPIALVEADASGMRISSSLGVLRTRSLAEAVAAGGALNDSAVYAAVDRTSLLVNGNIAGQIDIGQQDATRAAVAQLAEQHSLVLIDLGPLLDRQGGLFSSSVAATIHLFQPAGVLLVRRESDLSGAVSAAQKALENAGGTGLGIIENQIGLGK